MVKVIGKYPGQHGERAEGRGEAGIAPRVDGPSHATGSHAAKMILVPEDVLVDCFNTLGDCLCYPSGVKPQEELIDKVGALLGDDDE